MDCCAIDRFYLKANGEVPCWCSPGEHHPMLTLTAEDVGGGRLVREILNGEDFKQMRRALHQKRLPFDYCRGCWFLKKGGDEAWGRVDTETFELKSLDMVQVESSFYCNVDCPLCVSKPQRKNLKDPPYQMEQALYDGMIGDLAESGIEVGELWFSGRGEPLMNPHFPEMVRTAKERIGCRVTVHTNGNFRFNEEYLNCGLDEVEIALDGVNQTDYERYRRDGKLEVVAKFATDFAEARREAGSTTPELVWKMILFEWNSSDEALARAVEWAGEMGIDRLMFMNTDTPGGISHRDGGARAKQIAAWVETLPPREGLVVEVRGFDSAFGRVPDVSTWLEMSTNDVGGRRVIGRLLNELLEEKTFRVVMSLEDDFGGEPRSLVDATMTFDSRQEYVEAFDMPTDLVAGNYRIWAKVIEADSGLPISDASCDFVVATEGA